MATSYGNFASRSRCHKRLLRNEKAGTMIGQNEKGFVLVAAMIMLLIVLAIGVFASRLSTTESLIAGAEKNYKDNLYLAETAAYEGAQNLADASNTDLSNQTVAGLISQGNLVARAGNDVDGNGEISTTEARNSPEWDPATPGAISVLTWVDPARYMCVDEGYSHLDNLDMSKPVKEIYMCYGKSQKNSGDVTIRIEYIKSFVHE